MEFALLAACHQQIRLGQHLGEFFGGQCPEHTADPAAIMRAAQLIRGERAKGAQPRDVARNAWRISFEAIPRKSHTVGRAHQVGEALAAGSLDQRADAQ